MARIIPNENTWIAFSATDPADDTAPSSATDISAATVLTGYVISINASSQGNTVPTPALDTKYETSTSGTVQASFQADFYRDDNTDLAWTTLDRGVTGVIYIARFGGTGTGGEPQSGEDVEVWPVEITSRTSGAMSSNTVQTFTVTAAVPREPQESATVAA